MLSYYNQSDMLLKSTNTLWQRLGSLRDGKRNVKPLFNKQTHTHSLNPNCSVIAVAPANLRPALIAFFGTTLSDQVLHFSFSD